MSLLHLALDLVLAARRQAALVATDGGFTPPPGRAPEGIRLAFGCISALVALGGALLIFAGGLVWLGSGLEAAGEVPRDARTGPLEGALAGLACCMAPGAMLCAAALYGFRYVRTLSAGAPSVAAHARSGPPSGVAPTTAARAGGLPHPAEGTEESPLRPPHGGVSQSGDVVPTRMEDVPRPLGGSASVRVACAFCGYTEGRPTPLAHREKCPRCRAPLSQASLDPTP